MSLEGFRSRLMAGVHTGTADVARGAIADIGNTYHAILTQHAGWRAPHTAIIGDMTWTHEIAEEAGRVELDHTLDPQLGRELGPDTDR